MMSFDEWRKRNSHLSAEDQSKYYKRYLDELAERKEILDTIKQADQFLLRKDLDPDNRLHILKRRNKLLKRL